MSAPLVSIIMAVRNGERFIAEALDSIAAQSMQDFEVVVVDGDSTDASPSIARSYPRVVWVRQVGTGFANAWTQGLSVARAPFICFLDSDDLWTSDKLALQLAHLRCVPQHGYVVGRVRFFADPADTLPAGFKGALLAQTPVAFMPGTVMIRRSVVAHVGAFEPQWRIAADIVWFQRLREQGIAAGVIDDVLLCKRVHGANLSYGTRWPVYEEELLRLLKDGLDRQRTKAGAA